MHIMIFGGAFDPPHKGHQLVAKTIIENGIADELWYMPCYQHAFAKNMSPAIDRVNMLRLIETPSAKVSTYEIEQCEVSYSIDTLRHFSSTQPQHTFSWLIGSDIIPTFHKWKEYENILQSFKVFVYPREQFPLTQTYKKMVLLHDVKEVPTSSTEIRERIKKGLPISDFMDEKVERYILEHSLYNSAHE